MERSLLDDAPPPLAKTPPPPKRARALALIYASLIVNITFALTIQSSLAPFFLSLAKHAEPSASKDELEKATAYHVSVATFTAGGLAVAVAGWAGRLSDRVGRRACALANITGQLAMALLLVLVASRPHLGWAYGAAAWGVQGLFGGAYVFLATMMASVADWYPPEERGAAFSGLEGSMLLVAAVGPLVGGQVVEHAGFAAAFALCAGGIFLSGVLFVLAPPSPQPPSPPMPGCTSWLRSSTPALLFRLCADRRLRLLSLAFLFGTGGLQGGALTFVLYAQRFLSWGAGDIGEYMSAFSGTCAALLLLNLAAVTWLCGRARPSPLAYVRAGYAAPFLFFGLLAVIAGMAPDAIRVACWALLPLLCFGMLGMPYNRALFSAARPDDAQGETLALIAAIESLPSMYASPAGALLFASFEHQPWIVFGALSSLVLLAQLLLLPLGCRREVRPQEAVN